MQAYSNATTKNVKIQILRRIGLEKSVADELRRSLRKGKRYFKAEYQSHCQDDESQCPDHCRKFGLSDPNDPDFQEHCAHHHTLSCPQYDDNTSCLEKIRQIVKDGKTLSFYSKEQQDDLLYDIKKTSDAINQWKPHIMRSVNQECAKQDILAENSLSQETKTSLVFSFPDCPRFYVRGLRKKLGDTQNSLPRI